MCLIFFYYNRNKLINLCIGLKKWDADAIGFIQQSTMDFAYSNFNDFLTIINTIKQKELTVLIKFLADVENHSSYEIYMDLMKKLKDNNRTELYSQFETAKNKRIKQKHH